MVFWGVGLFGLVIFTIVFHLFLLLVEYRDFSTGLNGLYANFELAVLRKGSNSFLGGRTTDYFLQLDCQLREDS